MSESVDVDSIITRLLEGAKCGKRRGMLRMRGTLTRPTSAHP